MHLVFDTNRSMTLAVLLIICCSSADAAGISKTLGSEDAAQTRASSTDEEEKSDSPGKGKKKKEEIIELPPTVVRARRTRPAEAGTAFGQTIVIDHAASTAESASDALSDAVGVQVRSLGGLGSFGAASIRGSTPGQVTVYLDGVKLNTSGFGTVDLGGFSLDMLDSMDVYRGNSPMTFSSSGIGGVIALKTRKLKRPVTEVSLGYGSWSTAKLFALTFEKDGGKDLLAMLSMQTSRGDFEYLDWNGTWINQEDDTIRRRRNNQHVAVEGLIKVGFDAFGMDWTIMNDTYARQQGVAGIGSVPTDSTDLRGLRNSLQVVAAGSKGGTNLGFRLSYTMLRELFEDTKNEIGIGAQKTKSFSDAVEAGATLGRDFGEDNSVSARADFRWEGFSYEELLTGQESSLKQRIRLSISGQDEWKPANGVTVSPGARIEAYLAWFGGGAVPGRPTETTKAKDVFEPYWEANLGARYEPFDQLVLRANAGRYVRPPQITELFGDRGAIVGNSGLDAEKGYNFDLGLGLDFSKGDRVLKAFLEAVGFLSIVDDLVAYVQSSQSTMMPKNVDSARMAGVELRFNGSIMDKLFLHANYTYLNAVNTSDSPDYNGKRLPGRPVHEAYAKLELKLSDDEYRTKFWIDLDYSGDNYLDQANLKRDPVSRMLVGAGLELVRPRERVAFTLVVKNMFDTIVLRDASDRKYPLRDFEAFPLPGRTVMATLKARF